MKTEKDFIFDIIQQCMLNKIEFNLVHDMQGDIEFNGYFCSDSELTLVVNIGSNDWLGTLVHESCHMDQYLENDDTYCNEYSKFDIFDSNLWRYCSKNTVREAIKMACRMEIDCDKRAVKKIKHYNLDIKIDEYIRDANIYHWCYYYVNKYGIFPVGGDYSGVSDISDNRIMDFDEIWREHREIEKLIVRNSKNIVE